MRRREPGETPGIQQARVHRILADRCDRGLVLTVGQQIGDDAVGPAHRQAAGDVPLTAARVAPPSQPQVGAARLAAAGHVELVYTSDNVAQSERDAPPTGDW